MSLNTPNNNKDNIKRKPKGSPLALTISVALVLLVIAGYFIDKNKKATQANNAVESVQQTAKIEKPEEKKIVTEEEFNKQLENSVRESLGNTYGNFNLDYDVASSYCMLSLEFDEDLTAQEACSAGTTAVRAILNSYRGTDEIGSIIEGYKVVEVWIYSMKLKTGGELRGTFKEKTFMGKAIYRANTDRIECTEKWYK